MKEDFVSFELAKKLREKGYYYEGRNIYDVLKWLREVKGIDVLPQRGHINLDNKGKVTRYYNVDIFFERRFACTLDNDEQDYSTYEQAVIAGITFVIDNIL